MTMRTEPHPALRATLPEEIGEGEDSQKLLSSLSLPPLRGGRVAGETRDGWGDITVSRLLGIPLERA